MVILMSTVFGAPILISLSGGSLNETLPPLLNNFAAIDSENSVTLLADKMYESDAEYLDGAVWVYGHHIPQNANDGTQINFTRDDIIIANDTEISQVTTDIVYPFDKDFYARQFTLNQQRQHQTLWNGAIVSLVRVGAPTNIRNFQISYGGSSPTLTWENPFDDTLYHETVIVRKQGSKPVFVTDGVEIYRGTEQSVVSEKLDFLANYYFAAFAVSEDGKYRQPVTHHYIYNFPDQPTSYAMIEDKFTSGEFIAPEDGWYQIDAISSSGDGEDAYIGPADGNYYAGNAGGSGAIARKSLIRLYKGETINYSITSRYPQYNMYDVTIKDVDKGLDIYVTAGRHGDGFMYPDGGIASGGDINIDGKRGGIRNGSTGGAAVSTPNSFGYTISSGKGGNLSGTYRYPGEKAKNKAFVRFFRGNTNLT